MESAPRPGPADPAAGMNSSSQPPLSHLDGHKKCRKNEIRNSYEHKPVAHIPGYTGSIIGDAPHIQHIWGKYEAAAGMSTNERCSDEHEHTASSPHHQSGSERDNVDERRHSHGHPNHVIEDEDDHDCLKSDEFGLTQLSLNHGYGNKNISKHEYQQREDDSQDFEHRENKATAGYSTMEFWRWPYESGYNLSRQEHEGITEKVGELFDRSDHNPGHVIGYQSDRPTLASNHEGSASVQVNRRHGYEETGAVHGHSGEHHPTSHIPGYTGCIIGYEPRLEHIYGVAEATAGMSTMNHCPDEHEHSVPSNEMMDRNNAGNQHAHHGHPNHVMEYEEDFLKLESNSVNNADLVHRNENEHCHSRKPETEACEHEPISVCTGSMFTPAGVDSSVHSENLGVDVVSVPHDTRRW